MKKLNLGCGTDIKEGYINVDINRNDGVDKVLNLNKFPYPFKDNSVDEVYMEHVLEHLQNQKKSIEEIYRILKPKGRLTLIYPFWNSGIAHGFGHVFVYWQYFINYFLNPRYRTKDTNREYSNAQFKLLKETYIPHNSRIFRKLSNYIANLTKEIEWVLEK